MLLSGYPLAIHPLARRFENAAAVHLAAVLDQMAAQPGNPCGAEIYATGDARSCLLRRAPLLGWANVVRGPSASSLESLPTIVARYQDAGLSFRLEVNPSDLTTALARAGLVVVGQNVTTSGAAAQSERVATRGGDVERLVNEAGVQARANVYLESFGLGAARAERGEELLERHRDPADRQQRQLRRLT